MSKDQPCSSLGIGEVSIKVESTETDQIDFQPGVPETHSFGDEDWNTQDSSKDLGTVQDIKRSISSPEPSVTPKSISPPTSPITLRTRASPQQQRKRKLNREDIRESESLFVDIEKERIRQRNIELRQQDDHLELLAKWKEFMKEALIVLEKCLSNRKRK